MLHTNKSMRRLRLSNSILCFGEVGTGWVIYENMIAEWTDEAEGNIYTSGIVSVVLSTGDSARAHWLYPKLAGQCVCARRCGDVTVRACQPQCATCVSVSLVCRPEPGRVIKCCNAFLHMPVPASLPGSQFTAILQAMRRFMKHLLMVDTMVFGLQRATRSQ